MRENFFTQVTKRKMKKIEDMKLIKKIKKPEKLKIKAREKLSKVLVNIKVVAANITGMLNRFEYFTQNFLWKPKYLITVNMDPDLLTPGTNATH